MQSLPRLEKVLAPAFQQEGLEEEEEEEEEGGWRGWFIGFNVCERGGGWFRMYKYGGKLVGLFIRRIKIDRRRDRFIIGRINRFVGKKSGKGMSTFQERRGSEYWI